MITGPGQREQNLQALQQQLRVVQKSLQRRQNHLVILVLHELHQVVFPCWRHRKLWSAGAPPQPPPTPETTRTCFQEEPQGAAAVQLHLLVGGEHLHGPHHQAQHVLARVLQQQRRHGAWTWGNTWMTVLSPTPTQGNPPPRRGTPPTRWGTPPPQQEVSPSFLWRHAPDRSRSARALRPTVVTLGSALYRARTFRISLDNGTNRFSRGPTGVVGTREES